MKNTKDFMLTIQQIWPNADIEDAYQDDVHLDIRVDERRDITAHIDDEGDERYYCLNVARQTVGADYATTSLVEFRSHIFDTYFRILADEASALFEDHAGLEDISNAIDSVLEKEGLDADKWRTTVLFKLNKEGWATAAA